MTDFIYKKRCTGKTTELIKRSAETGAYIVVATGAMAKCVKYQAEYMGYKIPNPMGLKYFNNVMTSGDIERTGERIDILQKGILVDELQLILNNLFGGVQVHAVTITDYSGECDNE